MSGAIAAAADRDRVTVLRCRPGMIVTKRVTRGANGEIVIRSYDRAKYFKLVVRSVGNIDELSTLLTKIECDPRSVIIRGEPLPDINPENVLRRKCDGEDGLACFGEAAHQWIPIDIDDPSWLDPDPYSYIDKTLWNVTARLPPEFHHVSCHWQFTSGARVKPGLRLRLFYWADRPVSDDELNTWLPEFVDHELFDPVQAIYVARPIFDGMNDPLPVRSGLWRGSSDMVAVPSLEIDWGEDEGCGLRNIDPCELRSGHPPEFWREIAEGLGEGHRHPQVKKLAGLLFGVLEPTLAEVLLRLFCREQCDPPFGAEGEEIKELNDIINWTLKREGLS